VPGQLTPIRVRLRPAVTRSGAWITASLGVVFLGTGIVLGVLSSGVQDELETARGNGTLASNDPRITEGLVLSIGADVGFAIGGIMGLLSLYYFVRDPLPDSDATILEPRDWAFSPELGPDRAGGTFRWSF
jgi:hypothetical protein